MQTTAQLWLVYKLTNSAALLGVYGFANQIPILALAWAGGYVGDRYNRHIGVIWTQTLSMILAFVLAALTLMHLIQVWHLIFIAFLVGIVNAFDVPIRQAFLVQMVGGKEDLPSAIALNSSIFNGARVLGPAIGAAALAWLHEGWCFFLNGVSFLAVLAALLAMRLPKWVAKRPTGSPFRNFMKGFRFAMSDFPMRSVLLLLSTAGVGAVLGAVQFASRTEYKGLARWMATMAVICSMCLLIFSQSHVMWLSAAAIFVVGFAATSLMAAANTTVQNRVPDELRGRVMAVYATMFMGVQPLGSLLAGGVAKHIGAPLTLTVFSVLVLLGSLVFVFRVVMRLRPAVVSGAISAN